MFNFIDLIIGLLGVFFFLVQIHHFCGTFEFLVSVAVRLQFVEMWQKKKKRKLVCTVGLTTLCVCRVCVFVVVVVAKREV